MIGWTYWSSSQIGELITSYLCVHASLPPLINQSSPALLLLYPFALPSALRFVSVLILWIGGLRCFFVTAVVVIDMMLMQLPQQMTDCAENFSINWTFWSFQMGCILIRHFVWFNETRRFLARLYTLNRDSWQVTPRSLDPFFHNRMN